MVQGRSRLKEKHERERLCTLNDVNSSLEVVRFRRVESDCFPAISGQIDARIPSPLSL